MHAGVFNGKGTIAKGEGAQKEGVNWLFCRTTKFRHILLYIVGECNLKHMYPLQRNSSFQSYATALPALEVAPSCFMSKFHRLGERHLRLSLIKYKIYQVLS